MTINITQWSPDTCQCVFDYEWDGSLPVDQRVHTLKNVVDKCVDHSVVAVNPATHYATVLDENVRKNKVYGQLLTLTGITQMVAQPDGSVVTTLKDTVKFNHSWTGANSSRILKASISGATLTNQQKNAIQSWCDTNFGAGKVSVA